MSYPLKLRISQGYVNDKDDTYSFSIWHLQTVGRKPHEVAGTVIIDDDVEINRASLVNLFTVIDEIAAEAE